MATSLIVKAVTVNIIEMHTNVVQERTVFFRNKKKERYFGRPGMAY